MGRKNFKGTVTIINDRGRIRLRWRYQSKRCSISLATYNKTNLIVARKTAVLIEQDMVNNQFDHTLNRYKGQLETTVIPEGTIVKHFEDWALTYKQMDCEKHTNYNSVRNMLRKWGKIEQSNIIAKFNAETFCAATYNRRLTMLKDFIKWLIKAKIWTFNPLEDINLHNPIKLTQLLRRKLTHIFSREDFHNYIQQISCIAA